MFDRKAIAQRFFECFPDMTRADLAALLDVSWSTVRQWEIQKRPVPWNKLRYLVLTKRITWDWLLEGLQPKQWPNRRPRMDDFDKAGINSRFLAQYSGMTKTEMARTFNITHSAVSSWFSNRRQVPWDKLSQLIASGACSWEWLIDGVE